MFREQPLDENDQIDNILEKVKISKQEAKRDNFDSSEMNEVKKPDMEKITGINQNNIKNSPFKAFPQAKKAPNPIPMTAASDKKPNNINLQIHKINTQNSLRNNVIDEPGPGSQLQPQNAIIKHSQINRYKKMGFPLYLR